MAEATLAAPKQGRALNIAVWIVSALMFVLFTLIASPPKLFPDLMGTQQAVEGFRKMGYGDAFRLFIGASEFLGGIALLIPRLAFWSACGLVIIMIGAVYTHLTVPDAGPPTGAAIALVSCAFIAWARRNRALFLS